MQRKTTLSREFSEEGSSCYWEILKLLTLWFYLILRYWKKGRKKWKLSISCNLQIDAKKIITIIIIVIKLLGGGKNLFTTIFSKNNSTRRKKYFSKYIEMRLSYSLWEWSRTKFLFGREFGPQCICIYDLYIDFKVSLTHHVSFSLGTLDSHTRLHLVADWIMLHT